MADLSNLDILALVPRGEELALTVPGELRISMPLNIQEQEEKYSFT